MRISVVVVVFVVVVFVVVAVLVLAHGVCCTKYALTRARVRRIDVAFGGAGDRSARGGARRVEGAEEEEEEEEAEAERQAPVPAGAPQGLCTAQSHTGLVRSHTDDRSVTTPEPHLRRSPSLAPESATQGGGTPDAQPQAPSPVPAHARPGPQQASPVGSPGQQQLVGSQERNCRASAEATSAATMTKRMLISLFC